MYSNTKYESLWHIHTNSTISRFCTEVEVVNSTQFCSYTFRSTKGNKPGVKQVKLAIAKTGRAKQYKWISSSTRALTISYCCSTLFSTLICRPMSTSSSEEESDNPPGQRYVCMLVIYLTHSTYLIWTNVVPLTFQSQSPYSWSPWSWWTWWRAAE